MRKENVIEVLRTTMHLNLRPCLPRQFNVYPEDDTPYMVEKYFRNFKDEFRHILWGVQGPLWM